MYYMGILNKFTKERIIAEISQKLSRLSSACVLADGQVPLYSWSVRGTFTLQYLRQGSTIVKTQAEWGEATACG